jgi:hypothetical protein
MSNFFDQFDEPVSTGTPSENNFFDQFDEPQPADRIAQADDYNAELNQRMGIAEDQQPSPEQSERGFVNNLVRGTGAAFTRVGGEIIEGAGALSAAKPKGAYYGVAQGELPIAERNPFAHEREMTDEQYRAQQEKGYAEALKMSDALKSNDLGYDKDRNSVEKTKELFGKGNWLAGTMTIPGMLTDQLAQSIPYMLSAPMTAVAIGGNTTRERVNNTNGKLMPDAEDNAIGMVVGAASGVLERIMPRMLLRQGEAMSQAEARALADSATKYALGKIGKEAAKDASVEALTEAIQSGVLEYVGQRYGTDKAMSLQEAAMQGLEGALIGGGIGGGLGAGRGAIDAVAGMRSPESVDDNGIDQPLNGEEIGGGIVDDIQRSPETQEEIQQLGYNPERMVVMPDGTTAWESELPELSGQSAAAQHPAYARINETPDQVEASLAEPVAIDDEINSMMADLDNYRAERVRQTVQPAMQKAMSAPVQSGGNFFDQFDDAPATGLFDGVREMQATEANAVREQEAKRVELMNANFQENEEGGLFAGVKAPAEQALYEPVKNEVDNSSVAELYPADNAQPPAVDPVSAQELPTVLPVDPAPSVPEIQAEPVPTVAEQIDAAASEAALSPLNDLPEPTEAMKEAGNYRKAHVKIKGLDIAIENPRGSTRSGTASDGKKWEVKMHSHYGYIKRTEGADGDQVDVFIGPNPESDKVFIVDQINPDGSFDEHKILIAFDSKLKARSGYKSNYSNGWKVGPITSMSMDEFKDWVKNGDTKKPLALNQSEKVLDMVPTSVSAPKSDEAKPVESMPERVYVGMGSFAPKPIGKTLYRETNISGIDDLVRETLSNNDARGSISSVFVADSPDIALGQGDNKGVRVLFDGNLVSGSVNKKPGSEALSVSEYKTDYINKDALIAFSVPKNQKMRGLTKIMISRHFDNSESGDKIVYTKKGMPKGTDLSWVSGVDQDPIKQSSIKEPQPSAGVSVSERRAWERRSPKSWKSGDGQIIADHSMTVGGKKQNMFMVFADQKAFDAGNNYATAESLSEAKQLVVSQPEAEAPKTNIPELPKVEADLPPILTQTKKQFIAGMAKERGLKKDSPGYAAAVAKLEDEYTESVDRAQAELPFEKFNELNSDSPESINRQAYDALREDFGLDSQRYSLSDKRKDSDAITRDAAQAIIDRISKDWKVPVKIKLIDTIADLPNSIKSRMNKNDGGAEPSALIDESTGHVYINLSKVESERSIEELVFHEVYTHFGLRQLMGDAVSGIMGKLYLSLGAAEVDRLAKKYGVNVEAYEKAYEGKPVEMRRAIIAEELLAHMSEHTKPSVVKFAQELVGAIRAWLRKNGFAELAEISESDMRHLLKQSRETVTKGKNGDFTGLIYSLAGVSKNDRKALNKARTQDPLPEATQELVEDDDLLTAWAYISQREESFQLPTSRKKDLVEIGQDIEGMNGFVISEADELALQNDHDAENAWRIKTPGGDKAAVYQRGDKVWIDVSDLNSGDDGKRIYNIVANYAINTGRVFMGDPAGLSIMAKARRLENMLSSAMKFGTTRHLQPHKLQLKDGEGVPGLKWKKGDDINNIREMIITSYEAVKNQFPEIENLRYDPESDSFVDAFSGEEKTDAWFNNIAADARRGFASVYEQDVQAAGSDSRVSEQSPEGVERGQLDASDIQGSSASSSRMRDGGRGRIAPSAGRTTLERAVLTHSILRGTRSERSKILGQLGEQRSERLKKILYALPKTRPGGGFSASGLQENPVVFGIGIDSILRVWQDKMRPLLRTQTAIKEDGGTISEKEDAYLAEEAFHGKTENDLRKMRERYLEPMAKKMADYGIEREELDMYLWAKHAKERNAQIAKINPDMLDGGSGMTNAQADQVLDQAKKEGKQLRLNELAGIVYSLLDEKRKIMRHSLADDSMVDTWNNAYKYYVPLKGRAVDDSGGSYPRVGRGFDIRGKESLRALGRRTKPESPTIHAIKDTTESIIRYRKNEVGNALLALVEANPNPEYWEAHDKDSPDFERKLLKKQGEEVVGTAKVINKEDYFITKRDGKEYYIRIEDPLLMRAMKNMGPEKMNWVVRQLAKVSRFLSSMVTSYNPEFVITNFSRDIQTAILNLQAEIDLHDGKAKGKQITGKMIKSVPVAARAIYASLRNKKLTGNMAEWQKSFDEFRNDGANTGWFQLLDVEQQAAELADLMEMNKATVKGQFLKNRKRIGDFVSNINSAVENAIRLSVYKSAVDSGITRKQAASLAKNLTVNFNRKGEVGASMNALYMFFNASVQGTAAFARAMGTMKIDENGARKLNVAQKAAIGIMFASFGLAILNRSVAGEDDDGENWWDKVPDYVKERNLVLMKSMWGGPEGEYITIPLPYGYNVFNALATTLDSGVNGNKSVAQSAGTMVKAMMGAFSPLGVAESDSFAGAATRSLAPTAVKPLADLAANENFFGSKIFAENFEFGTKRPDSHLHLRSTNDFWVWTAEFLNDSTGGSPYRSGLIDVSPDKMGYMFNYFVGGAGQFYSRIVHLGIKGVQEREIEATEVPFVRRFTGKVNWYADQQKFYDRKEEIDQLVDERKTLDYGSQERKEFELEHKAMLSLQLTSKSVAAELTRLRKQRNKITDDEDMSEKDKEEKLKPIELKMQTAINRFNAAYKKVN